MHFHGHEMGEHLLEAFAECVVEGVDVVLGGQGQPERLLIHVTISTIT